jgi:DNA-binding beta-propeller fold protein YncE
MTQDLRKLVRLILALFTTVGLVWFSGSKAGLAESGIIGSERIVSWEPLPDQSGELCEVPAGAAWARTGAVSQALGQGGAPSSDAGIEIAKPSRIIADRYYSFAGVAVDPGLGEVVFADENLSSIVVYDRRENTPPAGVTKPKRAIGGERTFLEYVSSVYIDPKTGDIYGVNNDTMNWMPIFGPEATGDVPADGLLATPHTTFGIAVDEAEQEMFLTIQDDHAVVVFDKQARDPEKNPAHERRQPPPGLTPPSPVRILQGSRTRMADPHGIALNPRRGEIFVANWGTGNTRPSLPEAAKAGLVSRGRKDFPVGRVHGVPSSGYMELPSITVYAKGAAGDTAPLRVIQGQRTQLNWPTGVAVHPGRGELFVANDVGQSILVFRADAQGDVAPLRVLKGPRTLMKNPTGVAVDTVNNELWVANFGNHSGTVYRIDASGDVAPLRVIRSAPAATPVPMLSNAHTVAFDSKRDEILVAN